MRMRFVSVTYTFGASQQSLERHYRDLRDDLLRQGRSYGLLQPALWRPPVDIHETSSAIQVKLELAGVSEDQTEVTLYENALVVTGRRDDDSDHDEALCYHEAQVHYGPFRAEILLPSPVRTDGAQATYENGFLRIRLPKLSTGVIAGHQSDESPEKADSSASLRRLNAHAEALATTAIPALPHAGPTHQTRTGIERER